MPGMGDGPWSVGGIGGEPAPSGQCQSGLALKPVEVMLYSSGVRYPRVGLETILLQVLGDSSRDNVEA